MSVRIDRREFLRRSAIVATAIPAFSREPIAAQSPAPLVRPGRETSRTVAALDASRIRKLASQIRGRTLRPTDPGYRSACEFWDGRIFRRPGLVVRCASAEDIATSVKFARDEDLALAIRGGAHTRNSSCEGGLLINLSDLNGISVDPRKRVASVRAGLLVGSVDRATSAHNLATILGECPSVGISGLTLGGGLGRLMGQHGALCDNLLETEIITADGVVRRVNAEENAELFWAIRGGGGNFGIASAFKFRLHPVGQVHAGMLRFRVSEAPAILRFLRDYIANAPDGLDAIVEIGSRLLTYAADAQTAIVVINVCFSGDPRDAEKVLRPLRSFRKPASDTVRPMSYLTAQALADVSPLIRHARSSFSGYTRSCFLPRLTDDVIDRIIAYSEKPPSPAWSISLDHFLHGEVCRVRENEMAFSLRQGGCSLRTTAFQPGGRQPDKTMAWVRGLNDSLEPFSGGRMYMNYLTDQGDAGVRAAFGDNYSRLAELKKKYDPANFFRFNQNIEPGM
jgi:FAD/FMN-containing dehydrogenase